MGLLSSPLHTVTNSRALLLRRQQRAEAALTTAAPALRGSVLGNETSSLNTDTTAAAEKAPQPNAPGSPHVAHNPSAAGEASPGALPPPVVTLQLSFDPDTEHVRVHLHLSPLVSSDTTVATIGSNDSKSSGDGAPVDKPRQSARATEPVAGSARCSGPEGALARVLVQAHAEAEVMLRDLGVLPPHSALPQTMVCGCAIRSRFWRSSTESALIANKRTVYSCCAHAL